MYIKEELFKRQALFAALSLSLCLSKEAAAAAKKKTRNRRICITAGRHAIGLGREDAVENFSGSSDRLAPSVMKSPRWKNRSASYQKEEAFIKSRSGLFLQHRRAARSVCV